MSDHRANLTACNLGRVEQDGAQYCDEHAAFRECWATTTFCSHVEQVFEARQAARAAQS